jgi:uncharacterized membrane protein YeaQ/YmgE (transglycosylase-associated protein family)
MNWLPLIVSLVSGGVGGNIAAAVMQKFNLSPVGNTIAGIEGGGVGAQLLSMSGRAAAAAAAPASGMDLSSILSSVGCRTDFQFGNSSGGSVVFRHNGPDLRNYRVQGNDNKYWNNRISSIRVN